MWSPRWLLWGVALIACSRPGQGAMRRPLCPSPGLGYLGGGANPGGLPAGRLRLRGGGASRSKQDIMADLEELRGRRDRGDISPDDFQQRKNELKKEREVGKQSTASTTSHCVNTVEDERALSRFNNVKWLQVAQSMQFDSLEDPVSGSAIDKSMYFKIYGEMLKTLDGQDALPDTFVDFFFEKDSVNQGHLRFKDESAKGDWMDWAEEVGIQPSFEDIKAGETKEEKKAREKELKAMDKSLNKKG